MGTVSKRHLFRKPAISTTITSHALKNYREQQWKRIVEDELGMLNYQTRHNEAVWKDCIQRNYNSINELNMDADNTTALQLWLLLGSLLQVPKAMVELLQTFGDHVVDDITSTASATLNVIGLLMLLYPTIFVFQSVFLKVYKSYRKGFRKVYGKQITGIRLSSKAAWHTARELAFVRNEAAVHKQDGKEWIAQTQANINDPVPQYNFKMSPEQFKRMHRLRTAEFKTAMKSA